jgi:hypothetical protein
MTADIWKHPHNVRFTPESGHQSDIVPRPLCAKSGHWSIQSPRRYRRALRVRVLRRHTALIQIKSMLGDL